MFKLNDIVYIKPLKKEGEITKILNNNEYLVNVGSILIKLNEKELEAIRIKKRKEIEKYVDAKTKEIIKERDEIIGKATEEANKKINELKKLLKGL